MKKHCAFLFSIVLTLLLSVAACTSNTPPSTPLLPAAPGNPGAAEAVQPSSYLVAIETTLESIYAQVDPSVVNISGIQTLSADNLPPDHPATPFGRIEGSGFVWDTSGHIVTNNHVIADTTNITVTFSDGTEFPGTVVGTDADSDLAVLKIDMPAGQAKPLSLADSTKLKVGQLAIAIGNPFGLNGSMSVGVVSSLGRLLPANENAAGPRYSIPDVIQTDAAINPGNSGGVLLDSTGKVIGVTNSIATDSGTSAGVGFAIPSAIVQQVVPALIQKGRYDHPYLGIGILSLNPRLAAAMGLPANQRGALLLSITAGSPADKAGLKAGVQEVSIDGRQVNVGGDVIVAYDNQAVKSTDDLITFLARSGRVGQPVTLGVIRGGTEIQVKVTVGVRPSQ